jgi:hypothetical protein
MINEPLLSKLRGRNAKRAAYFAIAASAATAESGNSPEKIDNSKKGGNRE